MSASKKINLRQAQAAETRQKLIDTARKLFSEKGFAETSVRDIYRKSEIAEGLLYHYFPGGKRELLKRIIEGDFSRIKNSTWPANPNFTDVPLEEVLEWIYHNFNFIVDKYYDTFKLLYSGGEVHEFMNTEHITDLLYGRHSWLPELLQHRAEAGEVREMDYAAATDVVFSIMLNHTSIRLNGIGASKLDEPERRAIIFNHLASLWKKDSK